VYGSPTLAVLAVDLLLCSLLAAFASTSRLAVATFIAIAAIAILPEWQMIAITRRVTRLTIYTRRFRCANVPASALLTFFDESDTLIGRNLVFVYNETEFVRTPLKTKRVSKGMVA
jgi:hypothetical protein